MEGKKQIIKSTKAQRRKLTEFMSINRAFANGEFSGPLGSRRMEEQWAALRDLLSELGPDKSVGQWKQRICDLMGDHNNILREQNRLQKKTQVCTMNVDEEVHMKRLIAEEYKF